MKAFHKGMEDLLKKEGGLVNDQDDPGKETYCGISRRYFPDWQGWSLIDHIKKIPGGFGNASDIDKYELAAQVKNHYRLHFWNRFNGDELTDFGQDLPIEVFEQSVHFGVSRAVKHLQQAINLLNLNGKICPDTDEDGFMGDQTHARLQFYQARGEINLVVNTMNIIQGAYYIQRMKARPVNEKYRGWFKRVQINR